MSGTLGFLVALLLFLTSSSSLVNAETTQCAIASNSYNKAANSAFTITSYFTTNTSPFPVKVTGGTLDFGNGLSGSSNIGTPSGCGGGSFVVSTSWNSPYNYADCSLTFTQMGQWTLAPQWAGDSTYSGCTTPTATIRIQGGSTTSVSGDSAAIAGATSKMKGNVAESPIPAGGSNAISATGTVTFTITPDNAGDSTPTQCAESSGGDLSVPASSDCTLTWPVAGSFKVTASFAGDTFYGASATTSSFAVTVKHPTASSFSAHPSTGTVGSSLTYTVGVTRSDGSGTLAGSISFQFTQADKAVGLPTQCAGVAGLTVPLTTDGSTGSASCQVTYTAADSFSVKAVYSGSTDTGSSQVSSSSATLVTYDSNIAFSDLSTVANPNNRAGLALYEVTLTTSPSNPTPPSGAVTFSFEAVGGAPAAPTACDGKASLVVTPSAGKALCNILYTGAGTYIAKASLAADTDTRAATLTAGSNTVAKWLNAYTISAPTSATTGASVALSVTFTTSPTSSVTPTGSVSFSFTPSTGAPTACQGQAGLTVSLASGVASCTVTFASAGTWTPSAVYAGDTSNVGKTANTFSAISVTIPTTTPVSTTTAPGGSTTTPSSTTTSPSGTSATNPAGTPGGTSTTSPGTSTTTPGTTTVLGSTTAPGGSTVHAVDLRTSMSVSIENKTKQEEERQYTKKGWAYSAKSTEELQTIDDQFYQGRFLRSD